MIGKQIYTMNKNVILVYIDNTKECIIEFSWLRKSWLLWDINEQWDIVAFTHPKIVDQIQESFGHENLIVISQESKSETEDFWKGYSFVNSFSMFNSEDILKEITEKYDFIFRTDCNTFLTKHFKTFTPSEGMVYLGVGQHYDSGTNDNLKQLTEIVRQVAKRLDLPYNEISHISSSILGSSITVSNIIRLQYIVTKYLFNHGWSGGDDGNWPGWFKGVSNLYAMDIASNSILSPKMIHMGSLDGQCISNPITSLDLHIRAWEQAEEKMFNKELFHSGELPTLKRNKIPVSAGDYCHMVASQPLEQLKEAAKI